MKGMPRQACLDAPGMLHHVIIRGIEKRRIVDDAKDQEGKEKRTRKEKMISLISQERPPYLPQKAYNNGCQYRISYDCSPLLL